MYIDCPIFSILSMTVSINEDEKELSAMNEKKTGNDEIRMENMSWPDIAAAIDSGMTTAVVGVGATEQHGPHLPLKTDAVIGDELAFRVAKLMGNALQAPTLRIGCSEHHLAFAGSISLKEETLKAVIGDTIHSLVTHGFETIVILPSHGGNFIAVSESIEKAREMYPNCRIVGYTDLFGFISAPLRIARQEGVSQEEGGAHAGEIETSMIMALCPNQVNEERFTPGYLGPLGEEQVQIILEKGMPGLTENGVLGDPSKSNSDRGERYLESLAEFLAADIQKQLEEYGSSKETTK